MYGVPSVPGDWKAHTTVILKNKRDDTSNRPTLFKHVTSFYILLSFFYFNTLLVPFNILI